MLVFGGLSGAVIPEARLLNDLWILQSEPIGGRSLYLGFVLLLLNHLSVSVDDFDDDSPLDVTELSRDFPLQIILLLVVSGLLFSALISGAALLMIRFEAISVFFCLKW